MATIGDSYFISKKIRRILKVWRRRILKQKYYRLKKDFSVTFFEKRLQSLILIQMKISTLCVSKDKNGIKNMDNPNFLHDEFSHFVENQNVRKEMKYDCKYDMKAKLFDADMAKDNTNNNRKNERLINDCPRKGFTPTQSGILGVGLRTFLSPKSNRK